MPTDQAAALANSWLALFPHRAPSAAGVRAAIEHAVAGRASYWDALLLTTAAEAGCHLLFSEDMHHGAVLSGVEIHNPFAPGGGLTARARELLEL
jgi:predicted nucleic acid-binding protein